MFTFNVVTIALIAPFFFLLTGAAMLPNSPKTIHIEWTAARSFLLGLTAFGLLGEFSLITGISWKGCFLSLSPMIMILGGLRFRHFFNLICHARWFFCYYLIALSATVTILFPIPNYWGGDWYENIRLGQGALTGVMPAELIGRTPMFGASSLPLAVLTNGLMGIAISNCVVAATTVFLMRGILLSMFGDGRIARWTPVLFCCSGIYLQHSAYPWAKFLASACLFAAAGEILWQRSLKAAMIFSSFWLAVAIATHQAAVLFVPAVFCIWLFVETPQTLYMWVQRLCVLAICLACVVAPYEFWTTAKFGWKEKVARNPSVYYRSENHNISIGVVDISKTAAHVLFNTFLPDPSALYEPLTSPSFERSSRGTIMRMFFFLLSYSITIAGTLIIAVMPMLCFPATWKRMAALFQGGCDKRMFLFLFCLGLAVIGSAILCAYSSPFGTLQAGLTPLGIFVFSALAILILKSGRTKAWLITAVIILQTLPWFLLQAGILTICTMEHRQGNDVLWAKFWKSGDFRATFNEFGGSLGYRLFPFQFVFYVATVVILYWAARRSTKKPATSGRGNQT